MLALKVYDLNRSEIYWLDIFKNPYVWTEEDVYIVNNQVRQFLQEKQKYYDTATLKTETLPINWVSFIYKYLDIPTPKEYQEWLLSDEAKNLILQAIKERLYDQLVYDFYFQLYFLPKEKQEQVDLSTLFQLPFPIYFKEALRLKQQGQYEKLYNYVIRHTSQFYQNSKLPTPYIPVLAKEHLKAPDWNPFRPFLRQLYFLYNEPNYKVNLVLSARQVWKSTISTYVSFLHLMSFPQKDILYIVQTQQKAKQPFQYFVKVFDKYRKAWIISISESQLTIKNNITNSRLIVLSSQAEWGTASFSSPIVIMDEASFISNRVFRQTVPIRNKPNWKFYAFSTVSRESREKQTDWFRDLFREVELGIWDFKDFTKTYKITLDYKENLTKEELVFINYIKKKDLKMYLAEYYCTLLEDNSIIDVSNLYTPHLPDITSYDWVYIWYDPAQRQDDAWITVSIVKDNVLYTIEEYTLQKKNYQFQVEFLDKLVKKYGSTNTIIAMDTTWVWDSLWDFLEKQVSCPVIRIRYIWNWTASFMWRYWKVPKKDLVDAVNILSGDSKLKVYIKLETLRTQIENYWANYEAIAWKDDVVESRLNAVYVFYRTHKNTIWEQNTSKKPRPFTVHVNPTVINRVKKFIL